LNRKEFWNSLSDLNEASSVAAKVKEAAPKAASPTSSHFQDANGFAEEAQGLLGLSVWCRGRLSSLISQAKAVTIENKEDTEQVVELDSPVHVNTDADTDYIETEFSETDNALTDDVSDGDPEHDDATTDAVLSRGWKSEPNPELGHMLIAQDKNAHGVPSDAAQFKVHDRTELGDVNNDPFANVKFVALTIAVKYALQLKTIILDSDRARSRQAWASLKSRLTSIEGSNTSLNMSSHVLSEVLDEELKRIWGESKSAFGMPNPLKASAAASSSCSGSIHSLNNPLSVHIGFLLNRYFDGVDSFVLTGHHATAPAFIRRPARRAQSIEANLRSLLTGSSVALPGPVLHRCQSLSESIGSGGSIPRGTAPAKAIVNIRAVQEMQRDMSLSVADNLAEDILLRLCGEMANELQSHFDVLAPKKEAIQIAPAAYRRKLDGTSVKGPPRSPPRRLKPIVEKRNRKKPTN
jgi:hypothetical protein